MFSFFIIQWIHDINEPFIALPASLVSLRNTVASIYASVKPIPNPSAQVCDATKASCRSPYAGPIKFCEARLLRRIGVQDCKKGYATGHHQISICVVTFVIIAHTLNHILIITINTRGVGKVRCAENNLCLFPESNFHKCFEIKNVIFHRGVRDFSRRKTTGHSFKATLY